MESAFGLGGRSVPSIYVWFSLGERGRCERMDGGYRSTRSFAVACRRAGGQVVIKTRPVLSRVSIPNNNKGMRTCERCPCCARSVLAERSACTVEPRDVTPAENFEFIVGSLRWKEKAVGRSRRRAAFFLFRPTRLALLAYPFATVDARRGVKASRCRQSQPQAFALRRSLVHYLPMPMLWQIHFHVRKTAHIYFFLRCLRVHTCRSSRFRALHMSHI